MTSHNEEEYPKACPYCGEKHIHDIRAIVRKSQLENETPEQFCFRFKLYETMFNIGRKAIETEE